MSSSAARRPQLNETTGAGAAIARAAQAILNSDGAAAIDLPKVVNQWRGETPVDAPIDGIDVIDMFAGCGGMSAGFAALNTITPLFRHVFAVDIDQVANRTYATNMGLSPTNVSVHELATDLGKLDALMASTDRNPANPLVLIGCAPCQGFSSHRNSAGASDPRNGLFVDFARVAAHLKPDYVIVENVPEILTNRYWPVVAEGRRLLTEAGYSTHLAAHNMAEFGVPQERFRAVLTASRSGFTGPEPSHERHNFRTVRDAIGSLPPVAPGSSDPDDRMHRTVGHRPSTVETIKLVSPDGGKLPLHLGPKSLQALSARQKKPGYEDVYGRLFWDKPSITMTAYSRNPASGRFVHPEQHRGLSIREAACLQSFPRSFEFEGTLDQSFRQIGNAVPPLFAANLAVSVLADLVKLKKSDTEPATETGLSRPIGDSFSRLIPSLKAGSLRLGRAMRSEAGVG